MKTRLCLLLTLCLPHLVHANGAAFGSGNDATGGLISTDSKLRLLEEHPTVSIQSENLHVRLYAGHAMVDLTYKFKNDGRKTKAIVGFPSIGTEESPAGPGPELPPLGTKLQGNPKDLDAYTISLNGKILDWRLYSMGHPDNVGVTAKPGQWVDMFHSTQWLVSELPLAGNSENAVHITYSCPYELTMGLFEISTTFSDATFAYKLSTGRNWHGPIHEGHVEIECIGVPADCVTIAPQNRFKRVGDSFIWEFAELKPGTEDDIKVIADPRHEKRREGYILYPDRWYFSPVPCTATASSELNEDGRRFTARNLTNGLGSCWAEGVEGDGIGESVTLSLKKACKIGGFSLSNGFHQKGGSPQELRALYETNNRVAELEIKVDEKPSFRVPVPDQSAPSFIRFPHGATMAHQVKLTIAAVYRGTKYRDTCIGAIELRQVLTKEPQDLQAR